MPAKTISLRLDEDRAERLKLIAQAKGVSMNQVILEAIDVAFEALKTDETFKERLREGAQKYSRALELLE